jgi:opacity protein-like surface antigen
MRSALFIAVAAVLFASATHAAHADSITYDLTLTANPGSLYGGTGTLTVDTAPSSSGLSTYTVGGGLEGLTFTLDNETFTLAGAQGTPLVEFLNGSIYDITFAEQIGSSPYRFDLQTSGVYAFYYNNEQSESSGTFTAALAPSTSPVPEPSTLALFGTGVLGLAGAARRKLFRS